MNNSIIVCDNKNCEFSFSKNCVAGVPHVKAEVSANYCDFECAIEAEGWITGIFLRLARDR